MTSNLQPPPRYVAVLEDDTRRTDRMGALFTGSDLAHRATLVVWSEALTFTNWMRGHVREIRAISLDHDLEDRYGSSRFENTGTEVARWLADAEESLRSVPVIIHSANSGPAENMKLILTDAGFRCQQVSPFGDLSWIRLRWIPAMAKILRGR